MDSLTDIKSRLLAVEPDLSSAPAVPFHDFERDGLVLRLYLTDRLRRRAVKAKVWRTPALLTALKNASYGFDERQARSQGGRDGIFLLDRSFRPPNTMMTKLFDGYLDKPGSGAAGIAAFLGVTQADLTPVRLVSHHLRLLGVLVRGQRVDHLVLVDCDS